MWGHHLYVTQMQHNNRGHRVSSIFGFLSDSRTTVLVFVQSFSLLYMCVFAIRFWGAHSGFVVSTVASWQEGPGFKSTIQPVPLYVEFPCSHHVCVHFLFLIFSFSQSKDTFGESKPLLMCLGSLSCCSTQLCWIFNTIGLCCVAAEFRGSSSSSFVHPLRANY